MVSLAFPRSWIGYALTEGDPLKRPTYQQLLPDASLIAQPMGPTDLTSSGLLLLTNLPELRQLGSSHSIWRSKPRRGPAGHLFGEARPWIWTFGDVFKAFRGSFSCRLRLKERCSSWQLALLETQAPYQGAKAIHIQDITEEEPEAPAPSLAPLPDDVGPFMDSSVARWPGRAVRKPPVRPKQLLPMLLMVIQGGTAKGIRHALSLVASRNAEKGTEDAEVEAQALEICCIRWGPLSLQDMWGCPVLEDGCWS